MSKLMLPWSLPLGQVPTGEPPSSGPAISPATSNTNATNTNTTTNTGAVVEQTTKNGASTQQDGSTTQHAAAPKSPGGFDFMTMLPLIGILVLMYILMLRPQRKEEKRRKAMISEMKKGDRVMTIGGLIGRVVSIDNDEVVLKIDESANVKATYKKSSIQQVLVPGEEKSK